MKPGTRKNSSGPRAAVRIGGLAFRPRVKHGVRIYPGLHKWHSLGRPSGLVYATVSDLVNAGIPILDAREVDGVMIRHDLVVSSVSDLPEVDVPSDLGYPMTMVQVRSEYEGIEVHFRTNTFGREGVGNE